MKDAPLTAIIDPATALLSPNAPHAIRIVPSDAASQVHVALTLDGVLVPVEDDLTAIVSSATPGRHVLVALVNDGYDTVSAVGWASSPPNWLQQPWRQDLRARPGRRGDQPPV